MEEREGLENPFEDMIFMNTKQFFEYPDVLTVKQAAELLAVSKNTVYKLIRDKALPCRRIGSAIRISKKSIEDFMHM